MSEITVESLWRYPITGGPAVAEEQVHIRAGGIVGDRDLLVGVEMENGGFQHLSSKQAPELFTIRYVDGGTVALLGDTALQVPKLELGGYQTIDQICLVHGDRTPISFVGDEYDKAFSRFLSRDVRLLKKTADWQTGYGVHIANRAQATLHIIGQASVEELAREAQIAPDVRRFRPNIVLAGLEPHEELKLIGQTITIGDAATRSTIDIDRGTPRCPVPSFNPDTGEDLKDMSLRLMPKAHNRAGKDVASAGVYAHQANKHSIVSVGDVVSIS